MLLLLLLVFLKNLREKNVNPVLTWATSTGQMRQLQILAGQILPLLLQLGRRRIYKEPAEPTLLGKNQIERNLADTFRFSLQEQ